MFQVSNLFLLTWLNVFNEEHVIDMKRHHNCLIIQSYIYVFYSYLKSAINALPIPTAIFVTRLQDMVAIFSWIFPIKPPIHIFYRIGKGLI